MKINNIFKSIMGECNIEGQGSWAIFIRFQGCSAACEYCDTKESWNSDKGKEYSVEDIINDVVALNPNQNIKHILITGGEPFEQSHIELFTLFDRLLKLDYKVSVETNGLHPIDKFKNKYNRSLSIIQDFKMGITNFYTYDNLYFLNCNDFIKIVISNYDQFIGAISVLNIIRSRAEFVNIYFSPDMRIERLPEELFFWMKGNKMIEENNVMYNLQIHKFVFKDFKNEEN